MLWIIGFLTVVLVLDSLILVLLVLVQLPKKEAGIGQAFGGGATDALFGAGSGNALTKMTKYTTGIFFALTLLIYVLYNHQARARSRGFASQIQQAARESEGGPSSKSLGAQPPTGTTSKSSVPGEPLIGTNAPKVNTTVPATGNTNTRGLLTVPQAAPTPPPSGSAPTDNTAPKPAPPTAK
ncbi:MAG TPA: preprotein translocase subunit SecG [Verrucomicrobiae bacterium]|nr:preprotein translocase subunit SecG [Verrucomicrobiae bacterium]